MTWPAFSRRWRALTAPLGTPVNRRRVVGGLAMSIAMATFLVTGEAALRAELDTPAARVPTAVYSRPVAWSGARRAAEAVPVALGTVNGPLTESRRPVALREVPQTLIDAVLAIEDQRFFDHHGLDLWRIGGALVANLRSGRITQGGSTITQQLAKNLFLHAGRTPLRKIREAAMATVLEAREDKATILEAYLNEVYLGQDGTRAIHGVGAAARYYFGKDPEDLSLSECAVLAGMIQAPNRYNPIRNPQSARQRRDVVLAMMESQDRIDTRDAERARRTRVRARAHPSQTIEARYFLGAAVAGLPARLPARGAAVYTTLDPSLQRAAERAVQAGLRRLRGDGVEAALVAIDPASGDVLAMVGGRDYGVSQFNRATDAHRQPGSAFKPIVALAALGRQGGGEGEGEPSFTLASRLEDTPLRVGHGSATWEPTNYDHSFRGEVSFRDALEQSLNVPFARIGLAIGPDRIAETARRMGIVSPMHPVPSLALGSSEVTLLELVRAYGVLAAGGRLAPTRMVLPPDAAARSEVDGARGVQVTSAAEAYLVTSALQGVIQRGTGRALNGGDAFEDLAGKTGTSNDWRDAWFIAYSPALVVGAWVGYDDGRSLGLTGAGAALPIVSRFLDDADPGDHPTRFEMPDGIEAAYVRDDSDPWWGGGCGTREIFLEGTAPSEGDCLTVRLVDGFGNRWRGLIEDEEWSARAERALARFLERLLERRGRGGQGNR